MVADIFTQPPYHEKASYYPANDYLLVSLIRDHAENEAFFLVLCYPWHLFFLLHQGKWCHSFFISSAVFSHHF